MVEERELFTRALRVFNKAGIEEYSEPRDKRKKKAQNTDPASRDLVWMRRPKRLNKHPKEG